jgi:hypothetical protein
MAGGLPEDSGRSLAGSLLERRPGQKRPNADLVIRTDQNPPTAHIYDGKSKKTHWKKNAKLLAKILNVDYRIFL